MARKGDEILNNDIDSNCTESFGADIDIVVDRRVNFILQKTKTNTNNQRIQQKIDEAEKKLKKFSTLDQHNLIVSINNVTDAYWEMISQHTEDAYKQGFKDAMQLMFATK